MISISNQHAASVSFDQPIEMLHACHGKILQQCDTLGKLATHLATHGCDVQAQQAAQRILRYFDTAGKLHHLDEESDLFPALRLAAKDPALNELLDSLLMQHVAMLAAWDAVREVLLQLLSGKNVGLMTTTFTTCYRAHIVLEEHELLPLAARWLTIELQQQIGQRMSAQRGVVIQP